MMQLDAHDQGNILLVEDDKALTRIVLVSLEAAGFSVSHCPSGRAAAKKIAQDSPDLVLLDLGLPDMDGQQLIGELRTWTLIPIIVLSARTNLSDRIEALEAGADDFLVKPFHMREVVARIRTALRRQKVEVAGQDLLKFGDLSLDLKARIVTLAGTEVILTRKEFAILATLAQHAGQAVTQKQLVTAGWGAVRVDPQYLRIFIAQLRQKLEVDPAKPKLIRTEQGIGYRLCIDFDADQ